MNNPVPLGETPSIDISFRCVSIDLFGEFVQAQTTDGFSPSLIMLHYTLLLVLLVPHQ